MDEHLSQAKITFPTPKGIPFTLKNPVDGFSLAYARAGEPAQLMSRGLLTSNDPFFYRLMDSVSILLLNQVSIFPDHVYQFVAVIHPDLTGELFLNDVPISIKIIAKRAIHAGETIARNDIADIRRMDFVGVDIKPTDRVFCLLKVGWKFGLFFDLGRGLGDGAQLDIEAMACSLGDLYRYLAFEHVYKTLEATAQFDAMLADGWFPFIEIAANDFKMLTEIYETGRDIQERLTKFVERFDAKRLETISRKWWDKPLFKEKQIILQAGINAYLRNDQEGFVLCLKVLLSELEGILRYSYFTERGQDARPISALLENLGEKANAKFPGEFSLGLPKHFVEYLENAIFRGFDLSKGETKISRHSSAHGIAPLEEYSCTRALQVILALDQMSFYL